MLYALYYDEYFWTRTFISDIFIFYGCMYANASVNEFFLTENTEH